MPALRQKQIGSALGVPEVVAAINNSDRLWWAVASEQGEGFSGLATIINYNPAKNEWTIIQPPEIQGQQITDLTMTGTPNQQTLWLGTKISGEGNPYLPGSGLVAYRPATSNLIAGGGFAAFHSNNSPLVGVIPDKLLIEGDMLWVGTGNGVCRVQWQAIENPQSWTCWRWALMAKIPDAGMPIYNSLLAKTPAVKSAVTTGTKTVEVLWWSPIDFQTRTGRYEVKYAPGFAVTLPDHGGMPWQELIPPFKNLPASAPPIDWPGREWYWQGDRFVRGFDAVALNLSGTGPMGIGDNRIDKDGRINWNAMRGDLELISLSRQSTSVKYYSGWVDVELNPYLTVLPQERPINPLPNPLPVTLPK